MTTYVLGAFAVLNFLLGQSALAERNFMTILKEGENKKAKLFSTHLLPLEIGNGLRYSRQPLLNFLCS